MQESFLAQYTTYSTQGAAIYNYNVPAFTITSPNTQLKQWRLAILRQKMRKSYLFGLRLPKLLGGWLKVLMEGKATACGRVKLMEGGDYSLWASDIDERR